MKKTENLPAGQVLGFPGAPWPWGDAAADGAGSLLVLSGKADAAQIPALALGCLAIGCAGASFLAARRALRSPVVWGVAAGMADFACLLVLSLLWLGEPVSFPRFAVNLAASLAAAVLGGMLGAGMKRKKEKNEWREFP